MPHDPAKLIGAWRLIDWRIEYPDGAVTRPFGEGAHGYIIYSADGIMTASIASADRSSFGIANARNANHAEKAGAFDSYFHYAGQWRIEGEVVVHAVSMALNPDMSTSVQRRLAVFDGRGGLTLSAKEAMKNGTSRHHILQWQAISQQRL